MNRNGYCGKQEWESEQDCPLETGELDDCTDCAWFREVDEEFS